MNNLGICLDGLGRSGEGSAALRESLRLYRLAGDLHGCASAANNLGNSFLRQGRYDLAEAYLRQSVALCRQAHNDRLEALSLANLGEACQKLGRRREAIRCCGQGRNLPVGSAIHWAWPTSWTSTPSSAAMRASRSCCTPGTAGRTHARACAMAGH